MLRKYTIFYKHTETYQPKNKGDIPHKLFASPG